MNKIRTIFMGSPEFALPTLQALYNNENIDLIAVYSQPAKPKGRGMELIDTPVAEFAKNNNLQLLTPKNFRSEEDVVTYVNLKPDLVIVAAYGLILPKVILETPKFGAINVHSSILPRWRGAAPIHHAILAGDLKTGVTIMQMDEGLDTGDIIKISEEVEITEETLFKNLHDKLADLGAGLIDETVDKLANGQEISKTKQPDEGVTYASKISKEMLKINFAQDAKLVARQINALSELGAFFTFNGENIKILQAKVTSVDINLESAYIAGKNFEIACANSSFIQPVILQKPGKKPCGLKDFLNGFKNWNVGDKVS